MAIGLGPESAIAPTPAADGDAVRVRREPREDLIRIAEYTPYPRRSPDHVARVGFTRDVSASGMCLGVDFAEDVGSLLRVTVRDVDGSAWRTAVERVVWCSAERDGRFWIGLERLSEGARTLDG